MKIKLGQLGGIRMKFKAKTKGCQLSVKAKTSFGEKIDVKDLELFFAMYNRGFLKPKTVKKNMIEYVGPIGISFYDRFKKSITKKEFYLIIEQIVIAVQKLQDNNFSVNNLVLNFQNVYINEATKEVQFVYIPIVTGMKNMSLIEFFEMIIYSVRPADVSECEFVSRFAYFFKAMRPFDINKIEMFVQQEDKSVVDLMKKKNTGQSRYMTNKQMHYYAHYASDDEKNGLLEDAATEILEEEETGLLYEEATGLLSDEEETMLLEPDVPIHYPTLCRVLTDETICINKPVFRLGKEKSYSDYFISNNNAVSRSHADLITRGNRVFVLDLNSKNKTYINEQPIPVQQETEIFHGDRLRLANEEFVFYF